MSEDLRFLIFFIGWCACMVLFIRWMNSRERRRLRAERWGGAASGPLITGSEPGDHARADPDGRNWFERLLNQPTAAESGADGGDGGGDGGGGD